MDPPPTKKEAAKGLVSYDSHGFIVNEENQTEDAGVRRQ